LSDADTALGNLEDAIEEARKPQNWPGSFGKSYQLGLIQAKPAPLTTQKQVQKAQSLDPLRNSGF